MVKRGENMDVMEIKGQFNTAICYAKVIGDNAVEQMYKNANLKSSQAIINVNYSTSVRTVLGFYTQRTVTAYGTIIEFR